MTQHALWMLIYPLFEWSRGVWGGKLALLFSLLPEINCPQLALAFDNIIWLEDKKTGAWSGAQFAACIDAGGGWGGVMISSLDANLDPSPILLFVLGSAFECGLLIAGL